MFIYFYISFRYLRGYAERRFILGKRQPSYGYRAFTVGFLLKAPEHPKEGIL